MAFVWTGSGREIRDARVGFFPVSDSDPDSDPDFLSEMDSLVGSCSSSDMSE